MSYKFIKKDRKLFLILDADLNGPILGKILNDLYSFEEQFDEFPDRFISLAKLENVSLNFNEILREAQDRRLYDLPNKIKAAYYAPSDHQFGLSNEAMNLVRNPNIEIEVFRDIRDAADWLGWDYDECCDVIEKEE